MAHILLIDPDEEVCELLAFLLTDADYEVFVIHSLSQAITLLSSRTFDLVVTEALEQDTDFGFSPAFLAQLRSASSNTPILLCANERFIDARQMSRWGLSAIVWKPFDVDDLLGKIRRLLKRETETPS